MKDTSAIASFQDKVRCCASGIMMGFTGYAKVDPQIKVNFPKFFVRTVVRLVTHMMVYSSGVREALIKELSAITKEQVEAMKADLEKGKKDGPR